MNTPIVLLALNKKEYYQMAFNAAASIKHFNQGVQITLLHDGKHKLLESKSWIFDKSICMDADDTTHNGVFHPGKAKLNIYKYLDKGAYLYLDVDVICIAPFGDIVENCEKAKGYYYILQSGHLWASESDIRHYNGLPADAVIYGMNSSFMFMRTGKELTKFFERAMKAMFEGLPASNLSMPWGQSYPDELAMTVTCADLKVNPYLDFGDPIRFFGRTSNYDQEIGGARMVALFGPKGMIPLKAIDRCDKVMRNVCATFSMAHEYKILPLMKGKYANKHRLVEGGINRG
jgi:hypothetical protein